MYRQAHELVADLQRFVHESGVTQVDLQRHTGVSQSQISRILDGSAKRVGKSLCALCKYANIPLERLGGCLEDNHELMQALRDTWDGSEPHAHRLALLIRKAGPILRV